MAYKVKLHTAGNWRKAAGILCMIVLMTWGCGGARTVSTSGRPLPGPPPSQSGTASHAESSIARRLNQMVDGWTGTPYRMGGNDRNGIDCSGFARRIYQSLFDIRLPRTSYAQSRTGIPVQRRRLQVADLVFFRPPGKKHHVGIYMGKNRFAHASTRRGVVISELDTPYWRDAYWTARRPARGH